MPPIYVDLDDVVCRTTIHFLAILEREFGKVVVYEEIGDFDWWKACGLEKDEYSALFDKAHEPDELLNIAPMDDAVSVLRRWTSSGLEIVIVTGRPLSALEPTLAWLDRYAVPRTGLTMVDKYGRFEGQKGYTAMSELAGRHFRFAVEDSISMARFLASRMAVPVALLDCPWNRADPGHAHVKRFRDWQSIDEALANRSLEGDHWKAARDTREGRG